MAWKRYTLLALLLVASSVNASDLRQVADCEKPIYSLDQYASDQDLMLELAIKAYEECLLFVAYDHEQSEKGSHSEIAKANRAIERIPLDCTV